jgi:drug/metabolite transporter (DMT)-like permease
LPPAPGSSQPLSSAAGIVTILLTLLGWSSVPLFLRHFSATIDFWSSNGWRYGFSALLWAPVLLVAWRRGGLPRGLWKLAIVPSVANAAGQVLFTLAFYKIEPGLVTFCLRAQLIFVAVGAWMLFPAERVIIRSPAYLAGLVTLIVGTSTVVLQTEASDAAGPAEPDYVNGVLVALGSGILFAAYGLAVRKFMHGVNSVLAFAMICQYTALAMVVLMLIFGDRAGLDVWRLLNAEQMTWLLLSAVIGIALGHVFYYLSLARLGVAVTAGVLQLQPFVVALASMRLFAERLQWTQWLGGCIAVAGALLMLGTQWFVSRREQVSDAPLKLEAESGA